MLLKLLLQVFMYVYVELHNIYECKYMMYYILMSSHIETITWSDDMIYVYLCLEYL